MGMYQEVDFVNLAVQRDGFAAFTRRPAGFDMPEAFRDFQFGTELGNTPPDDDFADNRINRIVIPFCFLFFPLSFQVEYTT
jgi:hypothetical protein